MKTELINVTPKMARGMLEGNVNNRTIRPGAVKDFHALWERGEWRITHQGVGITLLGLLADGQHRLTFISELPEGTQVPINVTTGLPENAYEAIDQGIRRTMGDIYAVSAELASVGRFFAKLANSNQTKGMTNQLVLPYMEWIRPEFESLVAFCSTKRQMWASSPVRAAAIYQIKRGFDIDYIHLAYHALVHSDIDNMSYPARALMQQYMGGKLMTSRSSDVFCRSMRAFDSKRTGPISTINVKDTVPIIVEAGDFIRNEMKKIPDKAGKAVAKPSWNFNRNKA